MLIRYKGIAHGRLAATQAGRDRAQSGGPPTSTARWRAHIAQRVQALLQIDVSRRHAGNHDGARVAAQRVLWQQSAGRGRCLSRGTSIPNSWQSDLARPKEHSLLLLTSLPFPLRLRS